MFSKLTRCGWSSSMKHYELEDFKLGVSRFRVSWDFRLWNGTQLTINCCVFLNMRKCLNIFFLSIWDESLRVLAFLGRGTMTGFQVPSNENPPRILKSYERDLDQVPKNEEPYSESWKTETYAGFPIFRKLELSVGSVSGNSKPRSGSRSQKLGNLQ
jgi:hypothetical protein